MKALSALEAENHQPPLCWWHCWLSRRGRRTGKFSWASWQSLHSLWHGDQCQEDQADDKQHQWYRHRYQSKWTEAWECHKLQVPGLSYNWWRFQAWDTLQDSTDKSCIDKAETSLVLSRVFLSAPRYDWCVPLSHPSSCMLVNHGHSQQSSKEEYKPWKWGATARYYTSHTKTMLPMRKSVPRSSSQLDHMKTSWGFKKMQTAVIWSCFLFITSGQSHLARHSERGKKTRRTEEEVGRQHQGMDRPGIWQVPEGSGEQGIMEKAGCKIICGAPMTLTVKGLMMMMMMTHNQLKQF